MQIVPSGNVIGASVKDIDLAKPLSSSKFAEIETAFNRYAVLSFPQHGRAFHA